MVSGRILSSRSPCSDGASIGLANGVLAYVSSTSRPGQPATCKIPVSEPRDDGDCVQGTLAFPCTAPPAARTAVSSMLVC